ncbi:MAG: Na+/H+ antiporter NhaA [Sphingomonas sp.]|nr:Na+/H+ antiporter NhaA [Sphingomonas sp.]
MANTLSKQTQLERRAGFLLIAAAGGALAAANSPFADAYHHLLEFDLGLTLPHVGPLTAHALVADGLMAIFFLLVGMEVKREWIEGKLSSPLARRLPIIAAVAGMGVPALIYCAVVGLNSEWIDGWAIPTATDIAFAVAVLAILGTHAPPSIKLLLVSVAVVDDVGAVAIIALAYTERVDSLALGGAAAVVTMMALFNIMGVRRPWPYLLGFAGLWWLVLASGVHATIAGVLAALTVPLGHKEAHSTLEHLEHRIHPWVMFGIVPLFGFTSAGVDLAGSASLLDPLPLAVMLGLFIGKQMGVFAAVRIGDALGVCCRPENASWPQIYGASVLCGIGFTMSLFIGAIAFPDNPAHADAAKIGTLASSLLAAILGWAVLRASSPVPWIDDDAKAALRLFGFGHSENIHEEQVKIAPAAVRATDRARPQTPSLARENDISWSRTNKT